MEAIGAWIAGAIAAAGAFAVLVRRLSRDRTEIHKDKAEVNFLGMLQSERDRAFDEARKARQDSEADAATIAGLRARDAHQVQEIERLYAEVSKIKRLMVRLNPDTARFLGTDFQPVTTSKWMAQQQYEKSDT